MLQPSVRDLGERGHRHRRSSIDIPVSKYLRASRSPLRGGQQQHLQPALRLDLCKIDALRSEFAKQWRLRLVDPLTYYDDPHSRRRRLWSRHSLRQIGRIKISRLPKSIHLMGAPEPCRQLLNKTRRICNPSSSFQLRIQTKRVEAGHLLRQPSRRQIAQQAELAIDLPPLRRKSPVIRDYFSQ